MQSDSPQFTCLLVILLCSQLSCMSLVLAQILETPELIKYKDVTSVMVVENPIDWRQDCGSVAFPGFLELSGCESVTSCNLNVGNDYILRLEWMPAQQYDRLNYFIAAVKLFPHEQFIFVSGSDGPYESGSVFVHQEILHVNETFHGTGRGWSLLFVKEINGTMDVCYLFEVNFVNPLLNERTRTAEIVTISAVTADPVNNLSVVQETTTTERSALTTTTTSHMSTVPPTRKNAPSNFSLLDLQPVPSSQSLSSSSSLSSDGDWSLVCTDEGLFPHLSGCFSFHYCMMNNFTGQFYDVILQCPTDLVFCAESKICDYNASCPCTTPNYH